MLSFGTSRFEAWFEGLKLFLNCSLELVVGSLWKDGTYTLQLLLGSPLTA